MAQFEDDNQYAIHVAPDTEEPTDAAGMMHSLAGLVAQSVSAAFFRAPARSASISSSQSRGVDDAVGRDELAVTQSGHSTYSAASGHSNMSEADRTMSAVEAIRAEERKKKLAEMNAAKAANPSSSAINLGLQRSGSDFAKSAGRLKFSDEGEVLDGIQAGPSASKLGNVKFDDEGASRVASGVKFNEGEVDLEKGQGQGLLPKPPSRPMSARSKGGLKKVSTINERDVSRDDDPPLLDRVRSRELQSFSSTGNQRKLFSLGSNDERV